MKCDMCGSEERILYDTKIEGGRMQVCRKCSSYGEVVRKIRQPVEKKEEKKEPKKAAEPEEPEKIKIIAKNYSKRIKNAREKKGLKQDEMAQKIGEKTSVIRHLEHGDMKPSMDLARKLEKFLNVTLIQEYEDKKVEIKKGKESRSMTIGDMIDVE